MVHNRLHEIMKHAAVWLLTRGGPPAHIYFHQVSAVTAGSLYDSFGLQSGQQGPSDRRMPVLNIGVW